MRWLLVLLISIPVFSCSDRSGIGLVKDFLDAREKKDSLRYMAMVSPDMKVWYEEREGEGMLWKPVGRWSGWDDYFNSQSEYGEFRQDSNAVSVVDMETNDFYRLIDRSALPVQLTWWINSDKKIEGFMVKSLADSASTDRLPEFVEWASIKDSVELNYLMPEGNINPDGDRPQRWKKILLTWRDATGLPDVLNGNTEQH